MNQPSTQDLQRQVKELETQLLRAQKSAALGELVGTVTHEFNNVLMTIINYAKLGINHKDQPTRDKAFTKILSAGERAAKITNSVLASARNRNEDFERVDINNLIEESLVLLEKEMQKYRVSLELDLASVPPVYAVGNQVQQVIINLLVNARQAMPDGGRLIIRSTHDSESNMVDLVIRDFGTGIPKDKLTRIFDPYFSTKSGPDETGKGGTGLGLRACHKIIQAHQGKIRVESTEGQGTAFTIRLPMASSVTHSDSASSPAPSIPIAQSSPGTSPVS